MMKVMLLSFTIAVVMIATTACDRNWVCDPKIGPNQSYQLTLGPMVTPADSGVAPSCAVLGPPDRLAAGSIVDVSFSSDPVSSPLTFEPSTCQYYYADLDSDVGIDLRGAVYGSGVRNPKGQSSQLALQVRQFTTVAGCDYLWSFTVGWKDPSAVPNEENLLAARELIPITYDVPCPGANRCADFWDVTLERR